MKRARDYVRQYLPEGLDRKTEREALAMIQAVRLDTLDAVIVAVRLAIVNEASRQEGFPFVTSDKLLEAIEGLKTC